MVLGAMSETPRDMSTGKGEAWRLSKKQEDAETGEMSERPGGLRVVVGLEAACEKRLYGGRRVSCVKHSLTGQGY